MRGAAVYHAVPTAVAGGGTLEPGRSVPSAPSKVSVEGHPRHLEWTRYCRPASCGVVLTAGFLWNCRILELESTFQGSCLFTERLWPDPELDWKRGSFSDSSFYGEERFALLGLRG